LNLKELTWENHKSAERKQFASILLSGSIEPQMYYTYLNNQFHNYLALESKLPLEKLGLSDIARTGLIREDIQELESMYGFESDFGDITASTAEYKEHVEMLRREQDTDGLIAHMYVRHFGDMYGGSIISKRTPGQGKMYQFDDVETLKTEVRAILNDSMATEANRCFQFAIRLFEEMCSGKDTVSK
jgi:heme oxygenase